MAELDVTDILMDPDFMDMGIRCVRVEQTVGNDGEPVNTETCRSFGGVVTSNSGDVLNRLPDGERISGNIIIHTPFRLTDGKDGRSADIVIWQGTRFVVSAVNSYSHFGRGFVAAICDIMPFAGGSR